MTRKALVLAGMLTAGGDQRDRDRAKNAAKTAGNKKQTGDPAKRKEADAKALADKIAAKAAAKEAGGDDKTKKK